MRTGIPTEYYKKIDKSVFYYGVTITNKYVDTFIFNTPLTPGTSRPVTLNWNNRKYAALLVYANRKEASPVYQIRWDGNAELLLELKKEFIQSYLAIESKNHDARMAGKYFRTALSGGSQEVLIFRPIDQANIELETFVKIETPYDNIFKRLVEENVFGWLSKNKHDYIITKTTKWLDIKDLPEHENAAYVIYYLVDDLRKEIYIGSATRLGNRVVPGRHEIPGWSKFKYEIIHPNYHNVLQELEAHSIRAFAGFFINNGKVPAHPISEYKLVNKNWPRRK